MVQKAKGKKKEKCSSTLIGRKKLFSTSGWFMGKDCFMVCKSEKIDETWERLSTSGYVEMV
jgi:hypothetical protein